LVKLRLRRMGKKKQPVYKIVAADSTSPRDGRFIEAVGVYNPLTRPMTVNVDEGKFFKWMKNGAQPTSTVQSLLKRKGYMLKWRLIKKGADETTIASEMEKFNMLQAEKQRREDDKKLRRKKARKHKAASAETKTEVPAESSTPQV
jgi:small subunit ribosomal protein S16